MLAAPPAGKARAKKAAKAKAQQPMKLCFVCPERCMKGKRWCSTYNRQYDCMYNQAKKVGKTKRSREGEKPFELGQGRKNGENVMGWSSEDTEAEWKRCTQNPSIQLGLGKSLRLWLPVLEETHKDHERSMASHFEEGSSSQKNMTDANKNILMDHVLSSSEAAVKHSWCSSPAKQKDPDNNTDSLVVAEKRRSADEDRRETPAAKKARLCREKCTGVVLTAYKSSCAEKVNTKSSALREQIRVAGAKMSEAQDKLSDQTEDDAVLQAYKKTLGAFSQRTTIMETEEAAVTLEKCEEMSLSLFEAAKLAGPDVKIIKDGSRLYPLVYFRLQAASLVDLPDCQSVDEKLEGLPKHDAAAVDLFAKSAIKVSMMSAATSSRRRRTRSVRTKRRRRRPRSCKWRKFASTPRQQRPKLSS